MPNLTNLGRYTNLREVEINPSTNHLEPKTRTIKISGHLYRRFVAHSKKYYNVESYETILNNLLDYYEKENRPYSHFSR
jgi:hypothetical protein